MKLAPFRTAFAAALLALPLVAWADRNPDFDDDAKPILRMQPHLLAYVRQNFEVKDTGLARIPGTDDGRPTPPYLFRARPRGSSGPYYITLLIQPGPPGRILKVIDSARFRGAYPGEPAPAMNMAPPVGGPSGEEPVPANPPPQRAPMEVPPAPAAQSSETPTGPTADTPSGPISSKSASSNPAPSLEPPPDPPPAH